VEDRRHRVIRLVADEPEPAVHQQRAAQDRAKQNHGHGRLTTRGARPAPICNAIGIYDRQHAVRQDDQVEGQQGQQHAWLKQEADDPGSPLHHQDQHRCNGEEHHRQREEQRPATGTGPALTEAGPDERECGGEHGGVPDRHDYARSHGWQSTTLVGQR
jgi:hypothetical protein